MPGRPLEYTPAGGDPENRVNSSGMSTSFPNSGKLKSAAATGLVQARARPDNPYDMAAGNQARTAYSDAIQRLYGNPGLVTAQAQAAQGANAAGAARGVIDPRNAIAANRAGAMGGAGLAAQAGNARLDESMTQNAQYAQNLQNIRGQDQGQIRTSNQAGLQGRGQDDQLIAFYNKLLANVKTQEELQKLNLWLKMMKEKNAQENRSEQQQRQAAQTAGTALDVISKAGG